MGTTLSRPWRSSGLVKLLASTLVLCSSVSWLQAQTVSPESSYSWSGPVTLSAPPPVETEYVPAPQSFYAKTPRLATDQAGQWVAVWNEQYGAGVAFGDILAARSNDNGQSWQSALLLTAHPETTYQGAAPSYSANPDVQTDTHGTWVAVWNGADSAQANQEVCFARSTDNAQSFSQPVRLTVTTGGSNNDQYPRLANDNAGKWVAVWNRNNAPAASFSTDNGASWSQAASLASASNFTRQPAIATDKKGAYIAVWAGGSSDSEILFARTDNSGASWSAAATLNSDFASESDADSSPAITSDSNGKWVAVWVRSSQTQGSFVMASLSSDNGQTWSAPVRVSAAAAAGRTYQLPAVSNDTHGNWLVSWNSLASEEDSDILYALSTEGLGWSSAATVNSDSTLTTGKGYCHVSMANDAKGKWMAVWQNDSATADAASPLSATTTVEYQANLGITMTTSPEPVVAGQTLTYTVNVTNAGPAFATNVRVSDTLPSGVRFESATASQGTATQAAGKVTAELGSLAAGQSATVTLTVTAQAAGTITNTASVTSDQVESDSADNSASAQSTVNAVADLAISLAASPSPAVAGQAMTYQVTVSNAGPSAAANVIVDDVLPAGVTFSAASASQGSCSVANQQIRATLGTVAAGGTATISIIVTPTTVGDLTNTVTVSDGAGSNDPTAENNSASVTTPVGAVADLAVTMTGSASPVQLGSDLVYTITVRNNGPSSASAVRVADQLPSGLAYLGSFASQGSTTETQGKVECLIDSLASGASATVTVRANVQTTATLTNQVTVDASEPDPNEANNVASVTTTVKGPVTSGIDLTGSWDSLVCVTHQTRKGVQSKIGGTFRLSNIGTKNATASSIVRFYLSNDASLDASDQLVQTRNAGKLRARMAYRSRVEIVLPAGVSATGKYLIAVVDASNKINEDDETNNVAVIGPAVAKTVR